MYQNVPGCTRLYQAVLGLIRMYQAISRSNWLHQDIPDCIRLFQALPGSSRLFQGVFGCTKPYQLLQIECSLDVTRMRPGCDLNAVWMWYVPIESVFFSLLQLIKEWYSKLKAISVWIDGWAVISTTTFTNSTYRC